MADIKKFNLRGTILGVPFDVTVSGEIGVGPELVSGTAGGYPAEFRVALDDKASFIITGSLLGNPININGREAD